jgi:hypothetical protein
MRMLGINCRADRSPAPSNPNTILSATPSVEVNRESYNSYPVYVASEGLLVKCNIGLNSFASVENGVNTVLSNIPTTLGLNNQYYELLVEGGEWALFQYRQGAIVHENKVSSDSHKTVHTKHIGELNFKVVGLNDELRWCNSNITYVLEVRYFS